MSILSLFAPNLLAHFAQQASSTEGRLPALELLLARAERQAQPLASTEATLCRCFDLPTAPVAALSALHDLDEPTAYYWLRADPVHLRADQQRLRLFDASLFEISQFEAETLAATLSDFYLEEGLRFIAATPTRWYLGLPDLPDLHTSPLSAVRGHDIHDFMPQGTQARLWRTRLNEIQMLLHPHPINAAREQQILPPINSLWFWGEGILPAAPAVRWQQVWGGDALAAGLAQHTGATWQAAIPVDAQTLLSQIAPRSTALCLLPSPLPQAAVFERDWLLPLITALKQGKLSSLLLCLDQNTCYQLDLAALRRWWRRPQPWQASLAQWLTVE